MRLIHELYCFFFHSREENKNRIKSKVRTAFFSLLSWTTTTAKQNDQIGLLFFFCSLQLEVGIAVVCTDYAIQHDVTWRDNMLIDLITFQMDLRIFAQNLHSSCAPQIHRMLQIRQKQTLFMSFGSKHTHKSSRLVNW